MRVLAVLYANHGARTHVLAPGQKVALGSAGIENTPTGLWVNGKTSAVGSVTQLNAGETVSVFESLNPLPRPISLTGQSEASIGRSNRNDICLSGGQVSGNHARLRKEGSGWTLSDLNSRNGIYVNGEKIQSSLLREDDTVFLGGYLFRFHAGALHFESVCAGVRSTLKELSSQPIEAAPQAVEYPWFQRGPRNRPEIKMEEIEILSPPQAGSKPNISWLSVLLPPILMVSVMVVVAVVIGNMSGGGMSMLSLAFTVPMSIIGVIISIVTYRSQTKKWVETQQLAREKYDAHLAGQERRIQQAETAYAEALQANFPSADNCLRIAKTRDRRLWERGPADEDFLSVRIGTADAPSNVTVKTPQQQLSLEENPLLDQAQRLKEKHQRLKALPVTVNLREDFVIGLAGGNESVYALLCGLAALHSYEDVKICCVSPRAKEISGTGCVGYRTVGTTSAGSAFLPVRRMMRNGSCNGWTKS